MDLIGTLGSRTVWVQTSAGRDALGEWFHHLPRAAVPRPESVTPARQSRNHPCMIGFAQLGLLLQGFAPQPTSYTPEYFVIKGRFRRVRHPQAA
jgi:hypothetical protein